MKQVYCYDLNRPVEDIEALFNKFITSGRVGRPIFAAPFDMSAKMVNELYAAEKISGFVANEGSCSTELPKEAIVGRWIDRSTSRLSLFSRPSRTFLFMGVREEIGVYLLLELERAGIRKIVHVADDQTSMATMSVRFALVTRLPSALTRKLLSVNAVNNLLISALKAGNLRFDRAFAELREQTSFMRLQADDFVRNRIVLTCGSLGPGGAERQIHYTARGLHRTTDLDIVVGCPHLDPPGDFYRAPIGQSGAAVALVDLRSPDLADRRLIQVRRKLSRYAPLGFNHVVNYVLAYAVFLRRIRPEIVHSWMDSSNVCAAIAAQIAGIPTIIMSGRSFAPDNFEINQAYMRPGYLDIMANGSVTLLNNSLAGAEDYGRWLGIDPTGITVVPNGFEFPDTPGSDARKAFRLKYGIPEDAVVIAGMFRFSEEKRPRLWIQTARTVIRSRPNTRFICFGSGALHTAVSEEVQRWGLSDSILLPGVSENSWDTFAATDLVLLTSRLEGLPNVLVEAQAMGVPVICTGAGGMTETFIENETGFSVPTATPDTLATACVALIDDHQRRKVMGRQAAAYARQTFSVDRMIESTRAAYSGACGRTI